MKNEKEPYVPITEDQADNTYLEEFEAEMAGMQQGVQANAPEGDQVPQEQYAPQGRAPQPPQENKPVYKQWWFWLIIAVVIVAIIICIAALAKKKDKNAASTSASTSVSQTSTTAQQSTTASTTQQSTTAKATTQKKAEGEDEDEKAARYQYALQKAYFLCDNELLSKQALYNELIANGTEKDAADYAVSHVGADFNAIALEKAKQYAAQGDADEDIVNALVNNDLFTEDEAQYAVDHL